MSTGTLLDIISMAGSIEDVRKISEARVYDNESDVRTTADRRGVGETTDADELVAENDERHTTSTTSAEWRKGIVGAGKVRWTKEDLEAAVTSAQIFDRTLLADVPPEKLGKRTRSDDIIMEETLRKMEDASLEHLRSLEKTGPKAEELLETVRLFVLSSSGKAFTAVSGRPSAVHLYLEVGQAQKGKCRARNTWRRYKNPMKKVRVYLSAAIMTDGRKWCVETLTAFPQYVQSVVE